MSVFVAGNIEVLFNNPILFPKIFREHPLAALSHGDVSVVSSFNVGDAFSDCVLGETAR